MLLQLISLFSAGIASPIVSMSASFNVSRESDDAQDREVGIQLKRDGTLELKESSSYAYEEDYLSSGLPNAAIGDAYEAYWTGDVPTSGPFETWTSLDSTFAIEFVGYDEAWSGTLSVREIALPANTDSATVALEVTIA